MKELEINIQINIRWNIIKMFKSIKLNLKIRDTIPGLTIDFINEQVCKLAGFAKDSLRIRTRKREIVQERYIAMKFTVDMIPEKLTYEIIADYYGNHDHSTVNHAIKTINNLCETDKRFAYKVERYKKEILNKLN